MKTKAVLNNFLAGVLDPRASARVETDAYNQGLLVGRNIELHHLGGGRRRRGLAYRSSLPGQLTRVSSDVTVTCPNGGTTANANDDSTSTAVTTTTPVGTTNEFVVVHYDLGSAKTIAFADVLGMQTASGSSTEFCIQYSANNIAWNHTSPAGFNASKFELVDTTARDYRRTASVSARYWRVVRIGTTNLPANITLTGFNLWEESATISQGRVIPLEVSVDLRVALIVTHRSGAIWANGEIVDWIPLPYESDDIMELDADASDGELVITHQDYAPRALFEDTTDNFQSVTVSFSDVPQIDYNDSSSPTPVSEVQVITLGGSLAKGDTFQVSLEGARSAAVVYAGDSIAAEQTATAANFAREIQKLYTVPGFDGVSCTRSGANAYTVTFANGSAKQYELMAVSALTGSGTTGVTRTTAGTARTEPLWSATRGWPRTVAFFEKRLYFFGTRSRSASVIGSHVVDTANFDLAQGLSDEAVFVTLSGQASTAQSVLAGDSLQFFTVGGEYRYLKRDGEPVTPADVPKNQSAYGSRRIRPVVVDGTTVYVHHTGKALRDYKYDVNVDKYKSLSLTSLAPHLLNDIKDIAAWNGSDEDELNFVFAVNGDGTVAVLNVREEANVKALVSWDTQGLFKAVGVLRQDIFFLVQRTINGVDQLFFEQLEYGYYTDCAVQVTNSPASATVVGLGYLNGQECRVRADGFVLANVTPAASQATLVEGAFTNIEVGLNFNPELTPMPLATLTPTGSNFLDKRRVVKARMKVRNTLGLRMNGRPLPDRFWDLNNFDEAPEPYTGNHALEESTNWDEREDKLVSFTQVDPLPMEILGIVVTLESS